VNNKTFALGLVIVLSFLLELALASAACAPADTPTIISADYFELAEGETFTYDFNVSNLDEHNVSYAYALVDTGILGMSLNKQGIFQFTPGDAETGSYRVAILAVKADCVDTKVITLRIFDRPDIRTFEPKDPYLQLSQTETLLFRITAFDRDANESLAYAWLIDSKPINLSMDGSLNSSFNNSLNKSLNNSFNRYFNKSSLLFNPGFGLSGIHELSVNVTDSLGLTRKKSWSLQVSKVNRPPVLSFAIPNFMVFRNTAAGAYNLDEYFKDPEGGPLNFSYRQVAPQVEIPGVVYANITVTIDGISFVSYNPAVNTSGYAYFIFTAADILNLSTDSNTVKVEVVGGEEFENLNSTSQKDFCGDKICVVSEDCKNCPFDCGECEGEQQQGCKPEWNCTSWGPCLPAGFQMRNCTDINNCGDNRSKPDEIRRCIYNASCEDGLKNGIEEGVDCGGPCSKVCPSCNDTAQNQNESDIDCGGECKPCVGDKKCLKPQDCDSLKCQLGLCTFPSCVDEVRNQAEEGVDCGGPCPILCGNCSDGVQNRGEEGVDCGGRCPPCPKCDNGILNDDENLVDCGGVCRRCNFGDYFSKYLVIFIIIFVMIGIVPVLLITYFFFLLASLDRARKLYENNTAFAILVNTNRFLRKFRRMRGKGPVLNELATRTFIGELMTMAKRADLTNKQLHEEIAKIYSALLRLTEDFDQHSFHTKLKASSLPLFLKVLYAGYYKKADILVLATYVAPEQRIDLIMELQFLLSEAARG